MWVFFLAISIYKGLSSFIFISKLFIDFVFAQQLKVVILSISCQKITLRIAQLLSQDRISIDA